MGLPAMDKMTLAYMENALYHGASGYNANCPSFSNGYMANAGCYNPVFGSYYNQNDATRVANYRDLYSTEAQLAAQQNRGTSSSSSSSSQAQQSSNTAAQEQLNKDLDVLADYAMEVNAGHETFLGACAGGFTFAALENMQVVKHPFNSWRANEAARKMFDLKNNSALKALWESEPELMQRAYSQVHAGYRRMEPKWKGIQQWFAKPLTGQALNEEKQLLQEMDAALKSGNKDAIKLATERLKAARGMDGYFINGWNWVKNNTWNRAKKALGFNVKMNQNYTPFERIANKTKQIEGAMNATKALSFAGKVGKEFKGWFIFETVIEGLTKVLPTYLKGGVDSGNKQLLQSGVKAAASSAGWAVGRVIGGAVGAKAGALIGTAICPGVGTAAGAIIGFAGGCIGSWLGNQFVKKYIFPQDESTRLAKVDLLKTDKGKNSILTLVAEKYQKGETPDKVNKSLQNILASA